MTLAYQLDTGRALEYRLVLSARIERTLEAETTQQTIEATFLASQEILGALPGGGVRARMSLRPESLIVDGRTVGVGLPQEFDIVLAEDGRVVEIDRVGSAASEELSQVGIERLLPRLRPVLPAGAARPGDSWESSAEFSDPAGTFSLDLRSRLAALGVTDGVKAALVRTTYVSPVDREEVFVNAVAEVRGRDIGTQETWFALDGFLVRSRSDSVGRYEITFRPPGGEAGVAAVAGSLEVRLHTEMQMLR